MARILTVSELLEAAQIAELPNFEQHEAIMIAAMEHLAMDMAKHLGVVIHDVSNQPGMGGLCATYVPKEKDDPLPEAFEEFDQSGDWEPIHAKV